jgi:hypothetical protein
VLVAVPCCLHNAHATDIIHLAPVTR